MINFTYLTRLRPIQDSNESPSKYK